LRSLESDTQNTSQMVQESVSTSPTTSTSVPTPARKRSGLLWLIGGLVIFAVIVATAWFGLGMGNVSVKKEDTDKTELDRKGQEERQRKEQEERVQKEQEERQRKEQEERAQKEQEERQRKEQEERQQKEQEERQRKEQEERQQQGQEERQQKKQDEREQKERPSRMPESVRSRFLGELNQCSDFRCHQKVLNKYCPGYWNSAPECKRSL